MTREHYIHKFVQSSTVPVLLPRIVTLGKTVRIEIEKFKLCFTLFQPFATTNIAHRWEKGLNLDSKITTDCKIGE